MKKHIITATFLLLGLSSCSDYLDVNKNPSTPQSADVNVLLPPMFAQMERGEQFDSRYAGQYIQNWAFTTANNAWDRHGYVLSSDAGGEKWRSHYFSIGKNIDLITAQASAGNLNTYLGIAKAIRAWSWQSSTDWHGEMVVKQAFEFGRYSFDYDPQQAAYDEAARLANEAIADLAKDDAVSANTLSTSDLVYRGDRTKWTKFLYGVLARNAHHLSNKAGYDPNKVIDFVDKSLASNADNFYVPNAGTNTDDANFYGPLRNNLGSYRPAVYSVSLLDGTILGGVVDPRINLLLNPSTDGVIRGIIPVQGDPNASVPARAIPTYWGGSTAVNSGKGRGLFRDDAAYPIMTYAELQFIKAEAAFKKGDRATALAAYKNGIGASIDMLNSFEVDGTKRITTADRTKYLTSKAVAQAEADLKLSDIMLQKYIALYGYGQLESWVDMRRYQYSADVYTGFALPASLFPDNNGKPAQRVRPRYNSEYVWNLPSLQKFGADKPDYHTVEMWFSQKQ
ncbi:SusD/RagB family nutrient-binding outer membrane lipoprotein [Spirosoma rigui]|uniref:SusD/RagB family nutrient-binding outer membrane lipoprotein n=1 Tax=Spirosoma rigui TaxID=564064 RepID=UPI0009B1A798|nr:SusD/RagB family nutrient-binding outer membrane lipoprotein [Spirosoma rigui]